MQKHRDCFVIVSLTLISVKVVIEVGLLCFRANLSTFCVIMASFFIPSEVG